MITNLQHAGHRHPGDHDCFLMNCDGMFPELEALRARNIELADEVARLEDVLRKADLELPAPDESMPRQIQGEVGTIQTDG